MTLCGELSILLNDHSSLQLLDDNKRVRCSLSNHEMPANYEVINTYLNGKKYKRVRSKADLEFNVHKQHLVPTSKKFRKHQLFCKLTARHLNDKPNHVEKHLNGKRFKRALDRFIECEKTGEKFVARIANKRINDEEEDDIKINSEDEDDEEGGEENADDLSDLYPANYKGQGEVPDEDDESDDDDDGDVDGDMIDEDEDDGFEELDEEEDEVEEDEVVEEEEEEEEEEEVVIPVKSVKSKKRKSTNDKASTSKKIKKESKTKVNKKNNKVKKN